MSVSEWTNPTPVVWAVAVTHQGEERPRRLGTSVKAVVTKVTVPERNKGLAVAAISGFAPRPSNRNESVRVWRKVSTAVWSAECSAGEDTCRFLQPLQPSANAQSHPGSLTMKAGLVVSETRRRSPLCSTIRRADTGWECGIAPADDPLGSSRSFLSEPPQVLCQRCSWQPQPCSWPETPLPLLLWRPWPLWQARSLGLCSPSPTRL